MNSRHSQLACVGLRTKTARAIVVVVAGTGKSPRAVTRAEVTLSTPGTPALFQPYHEFMSLPWDQAIVAVRDAERSVEQQTQSDFADCADWSASGTIRPRVA